MLAISSLISSPEPGTGVRFFKSFQDSLLPLLTKTYNAISPNSPFLRHALEALLKPGKDPTVCGSYHPISLTNIDIRLYSKLLANGLLPLIPSLIQSEQVGFTPEREARNNILKTITLMDYAQKCLLDL